MKSVPNGSKNMTILIDSNIALDILLNRQPWYEKAALIFSLTRRSIVKSYVSASAITDIFYVAKKELGKSAAREAIKRLVRVFYPATVSDGHIFQALDLEWDDFEDSVQFTVGEGLSADYIVTRNTQDFSSSHIPAVTPEQFLSFLTPPS